MKTFTCVLASGMLLLGVPAGAQLSLEVRGGAAVGNYQPAAAGLETIPGPSFSGAVEYRIARAASVYAAYSRAAFGCEEGLCAGQDVTVTTQGYGAGVRLHAPRLPWVRAGAFLFGADVEAKGGSESDLPSPGYEVGLGVTVPLGARLRVLPGVYFRTQSGEERTTIAGAEIGVQYSFGRGRGSSSQ